MPYRTREEHRAACRRWYNADPQRKVKVQERRRALQARTRDYIQQYKAEHPCVDCGEADPVVLEFDHVRGEKKCNVANLVGKCWGLGRVREEIAKCEIRCANCHRRATHRRRAG